MVMLKVFIYPPIIQYREITNILLLSLFHNPKKTSVEQ